MAYLSRGAAQDGVFGGDGVGLGLHVGLARDEARGAAGVGGARQVFEAVAELHQHRPQPPWAPAPSGSAHSQGSPALGWQRLLPCQGSAGAGPPLRAALRHWRAGALPGPPAAEAQPAAQWPGWLWALGSWQRL